MSTCNSSLSEAAKSGSYANVRERGFVFFKQQVSFLRNRSTSEQMLFCESCAISTHNKVDIFNRVESSTHNFYQSFIGFTIISVCLVPFDPD